jgi:hypothetical protein
MNYTVSGPEAALFLSITTSAVNRLANSEAMLEQKQHQKVDLEPPSPKMSLFRG